MYLEYPPVSCIRVDINASTHMRRVRNAILREQLAQVVAGMSSTRAEQLEKELRQLLEQPKINLDTLRDESFAAWTYIDSRSRPRLDDEGKIVRVFEPSDYVKRRIRVAIDVVTQYRAGHQPPFRALEDYLASINA